MGYVPPLMDNQMLIYGNRRPLDSQLIYVTPSAERITFLDALSSESDAYQQYKQSKSEKDDSENIDVENRLEFAVKLVERKVTGKGVTIDFTA